jgi:hypothetical protein
MQTVRDRLSDIRKRIAVAEQRLGEMRRSTQDRRLTAILIENVTATLTLLSEHEARLETPLARTQGSGCRQ